MKQCSATPPPRPPAAHQAEQPKPSDGGGDAHVKNQVTSLVKTGLKNQDAPPPSHGAGQAQDSGHKAGASASAQHTTPGSSHPKPAPAEQRHDAAASPPAAKQHHAAKPSPASSPTHANGTGSHAPPASHGAGKAHDSAHKAVASASAQHTTPGSSHTKPTHEGQRPDAAASPPAAKQHHAPQPSPASSPTHANGTAPKSPGHADKGQGDGQGKGQPAHPTDGGKPSRSNPDDVYKAGDIGKAHTKDYGSELGDNKKTIVDALDKQGATTKEKALVLSLAMQETNKMDVAQADHSKSGGSKNVSAFNMNMSMLQKDGKNPGVSTYDPSVNLDDPKNLGKAAELTLQGIRERGANEWVAGARGGAEAAQRVADTGTAVRSDGSNQRDSNYFGEFNNSVATDYQAILNDPSLMTNNERVENDSKPQYG